MTTDRFEQPFSVVAPKDWIMVDDPHAVALTPPIVDVPVERVVVFRTSDAVVFGGRDEGFMAWPDDLSAWLATYPRTTDPAGPGSMEVKLVDEREVTVAGEQTTLIHATTSFTAEPGRAETMNFIGPAEGNAGTDVLLLDGNGVLRLVIFEQRDVAVAYHASEEAFSEERFMQLLESFRFVGS